MEASHCITAVLLALLSTTTYTATASCDPATFIKSTCGSTSNPGLCNQISAPNANNIKCDLENMSEYLMKAALVSATASSATVSKQKGLTPSDKGALEVCIEMVSDSVDGIKDSLVELAALKKTRGVLIRREKIDNLKTWLSAVLTNYGTCSDGFDEGADATSVVETTVKKSMEDSSTVSTVTLDVVTKIQNPIFRL